MSRRHKKPWVKRPYVPKPCQPTKSRSQVVTLFTAPYEYSMDSYYYGRPRHTDKAWSIARTATTTETMTHECSSKYVETSDVVWDGDVIDFSYPRFKACEHSKSSLHPIEGKQFVHRDWPWGIGNTGLYADYTLYGGPVFLDRLPTSMVRASQLGYCTLPSVLASSVATRVPRLIQQKLLTDNALLNFREVFSVLTFFAELTDLKSLPALLKKWTKTSHDISDKYLGVQFGVLPFYSDIKAILDRLNNLGPAIDEWNAAAQEANTRSYHITIPIVGALGSEVSPGQYEHNVTFSSYRNWNPRMNMVAHTNIVQTAKARAHVYLIPRAIPPHLITELKANIWGTNTFLSTAWEKIPFSFVVDWFLKIGSIIEEFEKQAPLLQYRILSAGYSIKVDTVVTHHQGRSLDDSDFGGLVLHDTFYKRVPISTQGLLTPSKSYELGFHTIDANKALLGTALMHQLLR